MERSGQQCQVPPTGLISSGGQSLEGLAVLVNWGRWVTDHRDLRLSWGEEGARKGPGQAGFCAEAGRFVTGREVRRKDLMREPRDLGRPGEGTKGGSRPT